MNPPAFPRVSTRNPRHTALIAGAEELSFADLDAAITAAARRATHLPPGIGVVEAAPEIGRVVDVLAQLRAARPVAVLAPHWTRAEVEARRALLGRWVQIDAGEAVRQGGDTASVNPDTALVLFTSGSSGEPRAVALSRRGIEANVAAVIEALDFEDAAEQTLFLPLSYSFGLLGQLLPALAAGVPTRLLSGIGEARVLIERGAATGMWSGVPAHWQALLELTCLGADKPGNLSHVVSAGDHLSPALRRRLHEAFPQATIYNNYGQTEAGPRILSCSNKRAEFFARGDGWPVGDFELRCGPDGELQARGTPIMLGYVAEPEATARKIVDGWLRTGDLAEIAEDGLVTILGRRDDLVNIDGERISLQEVEAALRHLDEVVDAAVMVEEDSAGRRTLVALLVGSSLARRSRRDIVGRLSPRLSWSKIPRRYYRVEKLPRSQRGKLIRSELRRARDEATVITDPHS